VSVTVPAGAKTFTFVLTTTTVTAATPVTISATYAGVTKTAPITVRPIALASLTVPAAAKGGGVVNGSVALNGRAPAGGVRVALSSSNTAVATVPANVTIPAGATTATFAVTTKVQTAAKVVTISGVYNTVTKTGNITVNP
jgi:hypothetical protein